jgi:hypothetical protein
MVPQLSSCSAAEDGAGFVTFSVFSEFTGTPCEHGLHQLCAALAWVQTVLLYKVGHANLLQHAAQVRQLLHVS